MIMPLVDSYPDSASDAALHPSQEPETLYLAIQQPPAAGSLAALRSLVIDSVSAPNSKRAYGRAVDNFLAWHQREDRGPFSKALLQAYRAGLEQRGLAESIRLAFARNKLYDGRTTEHTFRQPT